MGHLLISLLDEMGLDEMGWMHSLSYDMEPGLNYFDVDYESVHKKCY